MYWFKLNRDYVKLIKASNDVRNQKQSAHSFGHPAHTLKWFITSKLVADLTASASTQL